MKNSHPHTHHTTGVESVRQQTPAKKLIAGILNHCLYTDTRTKFR